MKRTTGGKGMGAQLSAGVGYGSESGWSAKEARNPTGKIDRGASQAQSSELELEDGKGGSGDGGRPAAKPGRTLSWCPMFHQCGQRTG